MPMVHPSRCAAPTGRRALPVSLLLLVAACRSARPERAHEPQPTATADGGAQELATGTPGPGGELDDPREVVVGLLRRGELRAARARLDELLIEQGLARARELVERSPEDALTAIDDVLDIAPRQPEAAYLKGRASLALADKAIAGGGNAGPGLIEGALQDALEYFQRPNAPPEAAFGTAKAATLLGDWSTALAAARRGRELIAAGEVDERAIEPPPARTLAEALFGCYVEARSTGTSAEDARPLFLEAAAALESLLGRTPEDPWVWGRLADLHEWAGDFAAAEKSVEGGLLRAPEDTSLLERLARVARSAGGPEHAAAALEAVVARAPRNAQAAWLYALERFEQAADRCASGAGSAADFDAVEQALGRATELDPARKEDASAYLVICRAGRGWSAFRADDLAGAERAFLSMNEVFPEGLKWSLPGRIDTGVQGLAAVADRHYQLEHLEQAGLVFDELRQLDRESPVWANNAGFILRDAATAIDDEGQALCALARGKSTLPETTAKLRAAAGLPAEAGDAASERARLEQAAAEHAERARALMAKSYAAYCQAAALAPSDVRLVNDTALILVYYLQHDLDHAEELLGRCVALGQTQVDELRAKLAAGDVTAEQRDALERELEQIENAWGDAFQNLGILYQVHRQDPGKARAFYERSLAIGPGPRTDITRLIYPVLDGTQDYRSSDAFTFVFFGRPCE
jgi:hypothetical protein